jgi:ubiquinol-cytochrome c reductase cytochrome b subunit
MFSAILILLIMPYTDLSRLRGIQFKPLSKIIFYVFMTNFLILMQLGAKHVESPFIEFGQISTVLYFSHFLIIIPLISFFENSIVELSSRTLSKIQDFFYLDSSAIYHSSSSVPYIIIAFCGSVIVSFDMTT